MCLFVGGRPVAPYDSSLPSAVVHLVQRERRQRSTIGHPPRALSPLSCTAAVAWKTFHSTLVRSTLAQEQTVVAGAPPV